MPAFAVRFAQADLVTAHAGTPAEAGIKWLKGNPAVWTCLTTLVANTLAQLAGARPCREVGAAVHWGVEIDGALCALAVAVAAAAGQGTALVRRVHAAVGGGWGDGQGE